jgi:hypothetical protein
MPNPTETTEPTYCPVNVKDVKPTETVTYVRSSGEQVTGVVESVNIDPVLGVVALSYLTNTPYHTPPVLTIPIGTEVLVHF